MSLNDISLPPSVLAGLFHHSLIQSDEPVPKTLPVNEDIPSTPWKWLGENKKNIAIVVNYDSAVHLPDNALQFLTNMLTACNLGIADTAIININSYPSLNYKEITTQLKSKNVFLFNVDPASFGLPLNFPHFQVQSFDSVSYLFTPSLETMENDKLLKSKLWVSLKKIFGIA